MPKIENNQNWFAASCWFLQCELLDVHGCADPGYHLMLPEGSYSSGRVCAHAMGISRMAINQYYLMPDLQWDTKVHLAKPPPCYRGTKNTFLWDSSRVLAVSCRCWCVAQKSGRQLQPVIENLKWLQAGNLESQSNEMTLVVLTEAFNHRLRVVSTLFGRAS